MSTIAILSEQGEGQQTTFSAVMGGRKATGRTAGEALDALTSQLSADETGAPVIVQRFRPDRFFSAEQQDRVSVLMEHWQSARKSGKALPPGEQSELERLVDEEVQGSTERAAQILLDLKPTGRLPSIDLEELLVSYEQDRYFALQFYHRASRLHMVGLLAGTIGLLLTLIGGAHILKGLISRGITTLVVGVVLDAISLLLLHLFQRAALERVARLYPQGEESRTHPEPEPKRAA